MRRAKLRFAGIEIEFVDRDRALEQVEELAEKGTHHPIVVYGPEGCGKTALLRQAKEVLEGFGYSVVYVDPMANEVSRVLTFTPSIKDVVEEVLRAFPEPFSRIVDVAITIAGHVMKRLRKPRIALLMDDVFQAIGLDKAERCVKTLLNLIEYPPGEYERIVVLITSSEGVSRRRIGRHRWATLYAMWNMGREGFEELYNAIPDRKPSFEEVWRWCGGNPDALKRLYEARWDVDKVVEMIVETRDLRDFVKELDRKSRELLIQVVEDPDTIFENLEEEYSKSLRDKLIELNLLIKMPERLEHLWIDEPPPQRDPELGIGRFYAWQTPMHREAVRKTLNLAGGG